MFVVASVTKCFFLTGYEICIKYEKGGNGNKVSIFIGTSRKYIPVCILNSSFKLVFSSVPALDLYKLGSCQTSIFGLNTSTNTAFRKDLQDSFITTDVLQSILVNQVLMKKTSARSRIQSSINWILRLLRLGWQYIIFKTYRIIDKNKGSQNQSVSCVS